MVKNKKVTKTFLLLIICTFLLNSFVVNVEAAVVSNGSPEIIGEAAIVMDMNTKEVLYSKNAEEIKPIASTTKLMTALLFAEHKKKEDIVKFTESALKITETSLNNFKKLKVGDEISAGDLMEATLIFSANDAAYLMAESIEGKIPEFVDMMNRRAGYLGMKNTSFVNPSGLEYDYLEPKNKEFNESTAYDLALLAIEAYSNQWIKEVVTTKETTYINYADSVLKVEPNIRNKIIGKNDNLGGKTGNEKEAGHCFIGYFEKGDRQLVSVVLNSQYGKDGMNVFNDTVKIVDYAVGLRRVPYKKKDDVALELELNYKIYGSFGKERSIIIPIILNESISYYKNELNDKNIKLNYKGSMNPWELDKTKEVVLELELLGEKTQIKGIPQISTMKLIGTNIGYYFRDILVILGIIIVLLYIIRIYNLSKRKKRRKKRKVKRKVAVSKK